MSPLSMMSTRIDTKEKQFYPWTTTLIVNGLSYLCIIYSIVFKLCLTDVL